MINFDWTFVYILVIFQDRLIFLPSEKWLALKNRFYFSFFLEKLSIKFRGKKVSGRRISTTESLRCARNSDREAEEPQIVLLFVSTASRRGCRKSSGVPHYPRKHSKISWTKWCKKIRRKERRGELDRINPEGNTFLSTG